MRLLLASTLLLSACAMSAPDDADYSPPLSKYEHVFHGVPANGSLPDIGKADATYPSKSTELLQYQSPVKDQNERGVCTIFTTTALMEHPYIKAGVEKPSFSEQYLQWSVKTQLGSLPSSASSESDSEWAGSVERTIVRRPLAAQRRAVAAATLVLPTPPLPV